MPSTSLEASLHRSRHQLRPRDELMEKADGTTITNLCDWLHDTPVTNRKEKRRALGLAKRFGCYEEKVPDKERRTDTTWVHSRNCPQYDWKKAFDKKVAEQVALPAAEKMFAGVDPAKTVPWSGTVPDDPNARNDVFQQAKGLFDDAR